MKKLFVFVWAVFSIIVGRAAPFNEEDLVGAWELVSCEGSYPGFTSFTEEGWQEGNQYYEPDEVLPAKCKYLYLGVVDNSVSLPIIGKIGNYSKFSGGIFIPVDLDLTQMNPKENINDVTRPLIDFSITNDNKLHLSTYSNWNSGMAFRFIIESLDDNKMVLISYDKNCKVIYQRCEGSQVDEIRWQPMTNPEKRYNLDGITQGQEQKGINIIVKEGKAIKYVK